MDEEETCQPFCEITEYDLDVSESKPINHAQLESDVLVGASFMVKYNFKVPRIVRVSEQYFIRDFLDVMGNVGGKIEEWPINGLHGLVMSKKNYFRCHGIVCWNFIFWPLSMDDGFGQESCGFKRVILSTT